MSVRTPAPSCACDAGSSPDPAPGKVPHDSPGWRGRLAAVLARGRHGLQGLARGSLPPWAWAATINDVPHAVAGASTSHAHRHSLEAFLRDVVEKRIREHEGELTTHAPDGLSLPDVASADEPSSVRSMGCEAYRRYAHGLAHLDAGDRRIVVARAELGYNDEQIMAVAGLTSPRAARQAAAHALLRLAEKMPDA
jgi:hypothetical protein